MANLVELYDLVIQAQALNGVPLSHGHVYVYALGRTKLMDTWSDIDGESLNPNPVILDNAGQAHIYVSDDFDYTLVFTDEFDNEIFSVDKYLLSKGEHSHADVAVAPSEHIGVSSYHVGEVTVYVPYLTGEVGKTYEGIDPIVVNNDVNRISANHIPLGVQDPLYFVEDSETACIIGLSGGTVPEGTMNESAFGYEDGQITSYNGSAFSAGNNYEEGSYIDIDGNTINVTGLQPAGDYQSAGNYVSASELENLQPKGDYYSASNPSGFITGVDLSDYATTAQLDEKLDKTDSGNFYPMEGNPSGFLTAHQSLQGYATEQWVEDKGYITGVDIPESANWNSTYNTVHDNSGSWTGGGVTGDYELSAGSGISIVDYPLEQKTVISVTAQGGNPEVEQAVIDNSATWNDVTAKADSTAIPSLDGYATEDWVTAQGYLTTAYNPEFAYHDTAISSIDESALYDNSAHARINTLAGRISDLSSNKLDTTAFSDVSGTFLTAHQDLSDYQTTAGMTAYQPVGDYLTTADSANFYTTANESGFITGVDLTPYQTTADMTAYQPVGDYLTTADSANFYTTANESGFITGVDLTPYQTTAEMTGYMTTAERADFYTTANESGFITGVPSETSGLWQTASEVVTANSGVWGGSALPISAGAGIALNLVDGVLVISTAGE